MTLSSKGICSECIVQDGINGEIIWAFKTRLNKNATIYPAWVGSLTGRCIQEHNASYMPLI